VSIADEAKPTEIPIKKTPTNDKCFPIFEPDSTNIRVYFK